MATRRNYQYTGFLPYTPLRPINIPRNTTQHPCMCSQSQASSRPVLVVGAGVIGLTTAIRLHEANHNVTILAQETPTTILSSKTAKSTYTSSGSGGLWMPVLLSDSRLPTWATRTFHTLVSQIPLDVGVDMIEGFALRRTDCPLPWFAEMTDMVKVTPTQDKRVPSKYQIALRFSAPVVQMEKYLPYLEARLTEYRVPMVLTGNVSQSGEDTRWGMERISEFAHEIHPETIIVNCTGVGAGRLCEDDVIPGRGVTLRVRRPKELDYHISEDYEDGYYEEGLMAYAIPRGSEMTLGGTVFKNDWREDATEEEIAGVRERAEGLLGVTGLKETARWTGLRPIREDGVRLGLFDGTICNYGHGGSGVTICWGCADEVVNIIEGMSK